ncbi:hypothetical protein Q7P37_011470 [Cladosporium fusiforme]
MGRGQRMDIGRAVGESTKYQASRNSRGRRRFAWESRASLTTLHRVATALIIGLPDSTVVEARACMCGTPAVEPRRGKGIGRTTGAYRRQIRAGQSKLCGGAAAGWLATTQKVEKVAVFGGGRCAIGSLFTLPLASALVRFCVDDDMPLAGVWKWA